MLLSLQLVDLHLLLLLKFSLLLLLLLLVLPLHHLIEGPMHLLLLADMQILVSRVVSKYFMRIGLHCLWHPDILRRHLKHLLQELNRLQIEPRNLWQLG